jgi:hypothetical protein
MALGEIKNIDEEKNSFGFKIRKILLLILFSSSGFFISDYFNFDFIEDREGEVKGVSEQITKKSKDYIESKVRNSVLIGDQSQPTITPIEDIAFFKSQNPIFYEDAVNGDLILIFDDMIVIFRESEDKIVNLIPR